MKEMRQARCVFVFFVALSGLLLSAPAASAQPSSLVGVDVVHDQCLVNCFGLEDQGRMLSCLIGCDNAAAQRPRGDTVTLSSEEYVARWGDEVVTTAAACHSTAPCPAEYGSCAEWSGYSDCGDPYCGLYFYCCAEFAQAGPQPSIPNCEFYGGDAQRQRRERYRVCFNSSGQSCTEYERISVVLGCGC